MTNNSLAGFVRSSVAGDSLAAIFHALAEPTRLSILEHLSRGEHRVRDIVEHMNLAQSTVSKHLSCLRSCGLVAVRIEGRSSWFSIADEEQLGVLIASANNLLISSGLSLSLEEHEAHSHQEGVGGSEPS